MERPISDVFISLSRELRHLSELTSALQDRLSPSSDDALDIEALQNLDLLNQTLDCLATYAAHAGMLVPCGSTMLIDDAEDLVYLAALAERLRGDGSQPIRVAATEVELF